MPNNIFGQHHYDNWRRERERNGADRGIAIHNLIEENLREDSDHRRYARINECDQYPWDEPISTINPPTTISTTDELVNTFNRWGYVVDHDVGVINNNQYYIPIDMDLEFRPNNNESARDESTESAERRSVREAYEALDSAYDTAIQNIDMSHATIIRSNADQYPTITTTTHDVIQGADGTTATTSIVRPVHESVVRGHRSPIGLSVELDHNGNYCTSSGEAIIRPVSVFDDTPAYHAGYDTHYVNSDGVTYTHPTTIRHTNGTVEHVERDEDILNPNYNPHFDGNAYSPRILDNEEIPSSYYSGYASPSDHNYGDIIKRIADEKVARCNRFVFVKPSECCLVRQSRSTRGLNKNIKYRLISIDDGWGDSSKIYNIILENGITACRLSESVIDKNRKG